MTWQNFYPQCTLSLMFTYSAPQYALPLSKYPTYITIALEGSSTIHHLTASLHALQQIYLFRDTLIMYIKIDYKGKMLWMAK